MDYYLNKIADTLKDNIGLDYNTIGKTSVEKIAMQRMSVCDITSFEEYYQHLCNNPTELTELLEFSVIPETWFFRDIRAFDVIQQHIQKSLVLNNTARFNILSIPCSTGEEPYSVAMYLLDQGLPESSFNIDAVDISNRALEYAEKATYGKNSFRGKSYEGHVEKYFSQHGDFYKLCEKIKNQVTFSRLNILHGDIALQEKYDFILCRNLLIYFDMPTKQIAFGHLTKFLKDTGLLFIGHSEFGAVPKDNFINLGRDMSFALSKLENPNYKDSAKKTSSASPTKIEAITKPVLATKKLSFESYIQDESSDSSDTTSEDMSLLLKAKEMANSAQYNEAETLCRKFIEVHGEHEDALYLLGLIASSKKQTELAESMLRKTLFLNPQHYKALIHLSLLLRENGDILNADLFRNRADRTLEKGK